MTPGATTIDWRQLGPAVGAKKGRPGEGAIAFWGQWHLNVSRRAAFKGYDLHPTRTEWEITVDSMGKPKRTRFTTVLPGSKSMRVAQQLAERAAHAVEGLMAR